MRGLELLSVVALLEDVADHGLLPVEAIDEQLLDAAGTDQARQSLKRRSAGCRARAALVVEALLNRRVAQ